ncbi:insulin-induced protein-domain-containing protein [Sordaria brevicollis]|uniref:Insulin-induced protein-domain-containing protein n=1 Tax=Sordaria brevicollis TaxID=83679 RepID=A0AAE0PK49_SORBR|nr:insulin-induced protein-domain-containing protein [Sordaria brevicollis]
MDQTSNSGTQDGPKIFRPIPRRPFNLASPPMISRKDESPSPAPGRDSNTSPQPRITAADLRFLLDPRSPFNTSASPAGSGAVTAPNTAVTTPGVGRSTSNLRNGFFFGEHLKEETEDEADDRANVLGTAGDARDDDGEEDEDEDESYQDTITLRPKQRQRRVSSVTSTIPLMPLLWSLLRTTLLFALGMGYGVLVTRLPNGDSVVTGTGSYGWRYLTFWGLAGVVLGRLLPWFDQKERRRAAAAAEAAAALLQQPTKSSSRRASVTISSAETDEGGGVVTSPPEADWPLVVRSIGAFVGIVFAIRRLPWTSTMQVSITLALANPFLCGGQQLAAMGGVLNGTASSAGGLSRGAAAARMEGAAVIETGVWMLSVLFCSCVCFGNIGRRLALNKSAASRGRWGGVR